MKKSLKIKKKIFHLNKITFPNFIPDFLKLKNDRCSTDFASSIGKSRGNVDAFVGFLSINVPLNVIYSRQWRRQGGTQGTFPPPEIEKNCCRKMMLFPKALFLASTLPKFAKNSFFLLNSYQKFSKFSQNFQTVCVFCPNARKSNAWFVKFF